MSVISKHFKGKGLRICIGKSCKIQITNPEQENYFIQNMRNFRCFKLFKTVNELVSVVGRIHTHDGWMKDNLCNRRNKMKRPGNKNDP